MKCSCDGRSARFVRVIRRGAAWCGRRSDLDRRVALYVDRVVDPAMGDGALVESGDRSRTGALRAAHPSGARGSRWSGRGNAAILEQGHPVGRRDEPRATRSWPLACARRCLAGPDVGSRASKAQVGAGHRRSGPLARSVAKQSSSGESADDQAIVAMRAVSVSTLGVEGFASIGQYAGRSMLVTGGQAPACETLVTRKPWRS